MKKFIKNFSLWTSYHPILGGVLSVILVASPFLGLGVLSYHVIENETLEGVSFVGLFAAFMVSYISFVNYANKL